jgi:phosphoglycolate phosphatase
MKRKVIIFDLDGVLVDSPKLVSELFLRTYPTLTQETMNEILCGNFHAEMEKFKLTNKAVEEDPETTKARFTQYTANKLTVPLYDGVKELLEKLHLTGYILTINTSALEKNCVPVLDNAGIKDLFDFVATKEVATSKVEKFKIIIEKYGVTKEETLFITDTLGDVREAEEVGIPTVAVTWGAHDASFFAREKHSNLLGVIDSVDQLEKFV